MTTQRIDRPLDLRAPGAIEQLLAFHRQHFGSAVMVDPPAGDQPPADQPPAGGGDQPPAPSTPPAGSEPPAPGKVDDLPDWAQKLIRETRSEAATNRTKATAAETKQAETLDAIARALGLKQDEAPDPAKLAQQLTDTQAQARQAAVELAVYRSATAHQGDPGALLDSRAFLAKVSDLDPTAADFGTKVDEAIKAAVAANPKLKTVPATGASGTDHPGGSGEHAVRKPLSLDEAVGSHYGAGR